MAPPFSGRVRAADVEDPRSDGERFETSYRRYAFAGVSILARTRARTHTSQKEHLPLPPRRPRKRPGRRPAIAELAAAPA